MQVVAERGIRWQVTELYVGSRRRERSLKRQGGAARRCRVCRLLAAGADVPASDRAVMDAIELGEPAAALWTPASLLAPAPLPAPAPLEVAA